MKFAIVVLAAALAPAWAQEIKLPSNIEALADKADEAVTVTMDKSMLRLAAKFLNSKDGEDAEARQLIAGLDSIYVRSFEFSHEGAYNMSDVDSLRNQLRGPAWGRLVGVRSKNGENVDVYFKDAGQGKLGGIFVVDAEPKELTIVHIAGTLDPEKIADLSGDFGIPSLETFETHREAQ